MKRDKEHFEGCLLGGAIGDALGAPVEFYKLDEIRQRYGKMGISNLECSKSGKAHITDDTQMTLFTAEGLLRAESRYRQKGICNPPAVVYYAYIRWLHTQGVDNKYLEYRKPDDGWLITLKELHASRAPGLTCLSALAQARMGTIFEPLNNSKGCGGVMRVAPVGLFTLKPFEVGCEIAAITHGHPSGYLAAGAFAAVINYIIEGINLEESIEKAVKILRTQKAHEECLNKIMLALSLCGNDSQHEDNIAQIGEGWVAEEALAISLYCALSAGDDYKKGICMAVNHSGDSDSTGAITGNIMGAFLGKQAISAKWIEKLELAEEIMQIANDLLTCYRDDQEWECRYPGH